MRPQFTTGRPALVVALAALLAGCSAMHLSNPFAGKGPATATTPAVPAALPQDRHSYARPEVARVTHVGVDLRVDFERRVLSGRANLDIQTAPGAGEIVLDTNGLTIRAVTVEGRPADWSMATPDPVLGSALTVKLPQGARRIAIDYETSPEAGALQWLTPEQTAGKRQPYLFSQGESILTRSWIPTQDSPGIRQSWSARIVAPAALRTVMSAENETPEGEPAGEGWKAWRFEMDKAVAPYLIAIAVGDIAFKPLGSRTGVYTEPAMMDLASSELVDMGRMVDAAEALFGPYRWGRYDVLVLPPAFPYGGMENPRLTFATPTILAGDRSLVSLIAHELAHSWSGNLVTNANWNDFWLNEGLTDYFENRIMERLYGVERAKMLEVLGWDEWMEAIEANGGPTGPDTRLQIDLTGRDPDQVDTDIAYNKGAAFLRTIERIVGRERFDAWLRGYFDRHAFQPITSELFLADIREHLVRGDAALESRLMLEQWIYGPGIPANAVEPESDRFATVDAMVDKYARGLTTASGIYTAGWSTQEWQRFLGALPKDMPRARLEELERTFRLNEAGNSEIRFLWLRLAIAGRYEPAIPSLEQFLMAQGRRKFVAPLFADLVAQGDWGRPIAQRIYARARSGYHPVTANSVQAILSR
ncbi:MAG: M1 family metallopeptidase [Caulobacteraceae bacterium]|nr:M1 family metallopeptidase [Caulobacteraceae bacterium]